MHKKTGSQSKEKQMNGNVVNVKMILRDKLVIKTQETKPQTEG